MMSKSSRPDQTSLGSLHHQGVPLGAEKLAATVARAQELDTETEGPGDHEVKFNGSGLASGVYFFRLQAGDFVSTKKMLVLK